MIRVAVTHDVDRVRKTFHYLTKSIKAIKRVSFNDLAYQIKSLFFKEDPFWNFEDILAIEEKFKIKSTFYFLNETIPFNLLSIKNWYLSLGRYNTDEPKIQNMIKFLHQEQYEIGVHGSYNSYNDLNLLVSEKKKLEKIIDENIIGIRQHHLNFDKNTWKIQQEAGFKYDSTWGLNSEFGFKDNKYEPFKPLENDFTVFPMVIMDSPFCNSTNKWEALDQLIKTAETRNSIIVLNWHPDNFNDREFPYYRTDFINIIEKLCDRGAEFDTLKNYFQEYYSS
ncbi:MAG: hypothetical protein JKY33_04790 [Bacteroidia bacterium]|nr:hypothetical protein [Bacteroidia bacterium]